ncbi:MAG: transcription antitermination factor NusB [Candidatus Nanopelagicales bacterium]
MTRVQADPPRRAALDVLGAVRGRDAYANLVLPSLLAQRGITGRDANFATELAYGTLRGQGTYDAVIEHSIDRPLTELDPAVHDLLRLGAHQLFRMNVPQHAAVATTVELTKSTIGRGPSGFVNAVMRRMASMSLEDWLTKVIPAASDRAQEYAIRYSHPAWIVRGFHDVLGDWSQTEQLLQADNLAPLVSLVARPGRSTVDELVASGAAADPWSAWGATWPGGDPAAIPAIRQGRAGVQDTGSQLVTLALANARIEGDDTSWLDMCAGPGGKAALLGGLAAARGAHLTAVEVQARRAALVTETVDTDVEVVVGDGRDARWATGAYDRVLVDVPCSGLGALRRRPEARWRRTEADVEQLQRLQLQLLRSALGAVRIGGVVAYVTCSPLRKETIDVVSSTMTADSNVALVDARGLFPDVPALGDGPTVQLWPHKHRTDAMYLALMQRTA